MRRGLLFLTSEKQLLIYWWASMGRTIIITLLNIAIPFLIRAMYIYILRVKARKQQRRMIDVTPPEWEFPVRKLIIIGLLLSVFSIGIARFFTTTIDEPYVGNITKSEVL